ncbi:MAG: SPOCS domain-containing protein [Thermacetogeniaceae bacterium]
MKCELLKIEQVIGQATVQATIREALIIPDEKPGVEQVVSVDGTVRVRKMEIIEDKVIISGRLNVGVVYVAQREEQPVHYTHGHIDFTEFAEIIGAMPGMTVHVNVRILDLQGEGGEQYHHHHDELEEHHGGGSLPPCQVGIIAVVEISVKVTQTQEINVLVEPDPGVQATTQRVRVEEIVAEAEQQTLVDGRFTVPDEKPGVERVLDVAAEIFITETKVVDGQALIEGEAVLQFMYVALRDSQPVHHMHHRLPFTQFVALPDLAGEAHRRAKLHVNVDEIVEHIGFDVIDGCTVKAELFLKKTVRVTRTREVDIVTAITDSTSVNYQGQSLQLEQVIGEERTQILVKEVIAIPDEKPGAAQVLDVKIVRVHIPREEIVLINDKVILGGIIHLKVIYVSVKENQAVHAVEARLKFRNFIAIPGAMPDMTALVNAVVEHATAHVKTGCEITVEIILRITGRVVQTVCVDVVLCPAAAAPPPTAPVCPPGTYNTTVTVQPGDTIFKYAITHHVSVDHILAANPGIDPNNLVVGTTVKIPCDP